MAKQYTLLVWNTVISQYEETAVSMNTAAVSGGSAKTMTSILPMKRLSVRSSAAMTERWKTSMNSYRMRKGLKSSSTRKG